MSGLRVLAFGAWDRGPGYPRAEALLRGLRSHGVEIQECRFDLPYSGAEKRRLREVLRLHQEKVPPGWDIVINARHGAVKASYERLERDLLRLLPSRAPRPDAGAESVLKSDHPQRDAPR